MRRDEEDYSRLRKIVKGIQIVVTLLHHAWGSVKVRINDRGPFIAGSCIDLSRAAANAIGMGGTARVSVDRH
ncbi:hypothetical protein FNL55_06490 [Tardiphaga sp. vice352]|uniref:RlpA-like double-psi beta-barrel domain-containing protein n=1 Tax=Tardiphaga sp. vice352 TaxID=2592816 RepID=UPI00116597D9|nr:hypothetical protein FNL53_06430 [Tardiphaga sp. vice278]QDM20659.1 hypothetical protein FIU28_05595 [Tardiphaga sp. vice154]QDM25793.1 hypothetical protein FNL56_06475 [Tardiphaga sp. vice304]QDM30995.1 hypothetical protein FNL55_06490 [Tardiphaga sp. vice352]